MSTRQLFVTALIGWPVAVCSSLAIRMAFVAARPSTLEWSAWGFLICAPIAIALVIARSQPTASVAQVLYDAEQAGGAKKPVVTRG
jgi:hypothetical protein